MQSKEVSILLNQLAQCVRAREIDQALALCRTTFTSLLKTVYAQVRGQAAPGAMRGLLELEIAIGGDDGDFREFDSGQMIDLFMRGDVAGHLQKRMEHGTNLSAAVDFHVVARWFEGDAPEDGLPSLAPMRFLHAWLLLFAEEVGIIDPGDTVDTAPRGISATLPKTAASILDEGKSFTDPITGMTFVFVPGGTFFMGDTFNEGVEDEKPVHEVTLAPFFMAICPVTQAQWKMLMPENPSAFAGDDHPVEQVTLADVMAFIDKLNLTSPSGLRFDLPTEAQWEYAARSAGKDEIYAGGQDPERVAWFEDNTSGRTAPVAKKAPNGLGLYDLSGNVWEWCRDAYQPEAYRRHEKSEPVCSRGGSDRVIRGGSWNLDAWSARCSRRFRFDPELFGPALGFRLVMRSAH